MQQVDTAEMEQVFLLQRYLRSLFNAGILKGRWYKKGCLNLKIYAAQRGIFLGIS
jgi:hypothetical protein